MECILFVGGIVLVAIFIGVASANRTAKAKDAYQASLAELRKDPTNPGKREEALFKGRVYSNLTRNDKGVTLYDEMAIKNDLDAAAAAAPSGTVTQGYGGTSSFAPNGPSHEERLRKLEELRDKGLLTADEYASRRKLIIDDL